ncbi:putative 3-oxoacyl-[acyl-carrier-protein] reductase FabG-like [Capsicum annuum]|nr:putative 3-oxoacyl-[acyl-carrier-protein] reductase FabG-like [Capsicum annuum]
MYDVLVNFIKDACGLSKKSKEQIVDIDAADVNYELAVLEYVEDIFSFYKLAEFELNPETLYLTMYILDRYLSVETASRRELQLVGISAMLIASKYEETWAPKFCDWSTYLQLLHPSGNNSGNLCTSMLHCVKLVVVDKVAMVGEVKLAMWNPHCLPISRLFQHKAGGNSWLQADELISMDSTVSGYATTSLFSKAFWVSINPLLSTGYQSPLKLDELQLLPPDFQAVRTSEFLQKNFPKPGENMNIEHISKRGNHKLLHLVVAPPGLGNSRLFSLRLMKLPKMLNWAWSIMSELQSSLPRSRQVNTTNKIKQKLPAVLPSPISTSQMHNGSNHAKVCTQQEKLNSSL